MNDDIKLTPEEIKETPYNITMFAMFREKGLSQEDIIKIAQPNANAATIKALKRIREMHGDSLYILHWDLFNDDLESLIAQLEEE